MHRSNDVSIWHGAWKYTSPGTSIQENLPKPSPESPPDSSAWQSVLPGAPSYFGVWHNLTSKTPPRSALMRASSFSLRNGLGRHGSWLLGGARAGVEVSELLSDLEVGHFQAAAPHRWGML